MITRRCPASRAGPDEASGKDLMARGDEEFAEFARASYPGLRHAAYLLTGDRHNAEDAAQTALVRTYAAWSRVRRDDAYAYARKVLVNHVTDRWRRRLREYPAGELPDGPARPRPGRRGGAAPLGHRRTGRAYCPGNARWSSCATCSTSPRQRWPGTWESPSAPSSPPVPVRSPSCASAQPTTPGRSRSEGSGHDQPRHGTSAPGPARARRPGVRGRGQPGPTSTVIIGPGRRLRPPPPGGRRSGRPVRGRRPGRHRDRDRRADRFAAPAPASPARPAARPHPFGRAAAPGPAPVRARRAQSPPRPAWPPPPACPPRPTRRPPAPRRRRPRRPGPPGPAATVSSGRTNATPVTASSPVPTATPTATPPPAEPGRARRRLPAVQHADGSRELPATFVN